MSIVSNDSGSLDLACDSSRLRDTPRLQLYRAGRLNASYKEIQSMGNVHRKDSHPLGAQEQTR